MQGSEIAKKYRDAETAKLECRCTVHVSEKERVLLYNYGLNCTLHVAGS